MGILLNTKQSHYFPIGFYIIKIMLAKKVRKYFMNNLINNLLTTYKQMKGSKICCPFKC